MNPPSALHSAMSRERKPFTYTPGGLDLSEIKSERMAKRLMRNAMNEGVPQIPVQQVQSPPATSNIAVPNFNCLPVQVFPTLNLPANPKSLLRTRSHPNQPREPLVPKVQQPQFSKQNKTENTAPFYSPVNNNNSSYQRPTSMYEYNASPNNLNTLPRMNYGSTEPVSYLPEMSFEAEYLRAPPRNSNGFNTSNIQPVFKSVQPVENEVSASVDVKLKEHSAFEDSMKNTGTAFNADAGYLSYEVDLKKETNDEESVKPFNYVLKGQGNVEDNIETSTPGNSDYSTSNLNFVLKKENKIENNVKATNNTINSEDTTSFSFDLRGPRNKVEDSAETIDNLENSKNEASLNDNIIKQYNTEDSTNIVEITNKPEDITASTFCFDLKKPSNNQDNEKITDDSLRSENTELPEDSKIDMDFLIEPISLPRISPSFETKAIEEDTNSTDEQREVKVVKKQVKKESSTKDVQNGDQNGDSEAQLTVKLPTKKSAAKTETKVEVVKKQLPDGSIEEVKTTITKTTVDGKTTIATKTETTIIPKEEEEEEEYEEEEEEQEEDNGEVVVQEIKENGDDEVTEKVIIKKSPAVVQNGEKTKIVTEEERSETTVTKKVAVVQQQEPEEEEEEEEEEVEEEAQQEEIKTIPPPKDEPKVEVEKEVEEEEVAEEEVVEKEVVEEEKVEEVAQPEKKETEKVAEEEKEEEVEEEYEEAEEKVEAKVEKPVESKPKDEESEYTEEEYESEKEEIAKPAPEPVKEEPEQKEPEKEETKVEEKIEPKEEKEEKPEPQPAPKVEPTVPLREPSIPLEKVEDVEIKPIGAATETVTKSHTQNTEIITSNERPLAGPLSTQTEYNRIENIVTVNRTTKTLDSTYEQLTQHGVPTVKTYFAPGRERISTSPQPSKPYQPVYPPTVDQPQERRHSLLLERLSMERQVPSSDLYQNNYQYNNQTYEQQRQWSQEPQAEVLNVSNVKPSTITNSQWYQQNQSKKENVLYNNVTPASPAPPGQQWNQSYLSPQPPLPPQTPIQPQAQPQPQYQPTYTDNITQDRNTTSTYQQNNYQTYTPKPTTWGTNNYSNTDTQLSSTYNTQQNQYSLRNQSTTESYQKSTQQYSSSYVPPPWEQDSSYVADTSNQNYYQPPPQTSTFTPSSNQAWSPAPPKSKFSKPPPTAYIPPAPNQSFVKAANTVEPPRVPGKKTYYSEYERRYITVPESNYIPGESKFQPQPDPSPQYYYDNNEPVETSEPQWRRELREFTEKTSQTTEQTSVKPPWEEDSKYAKPPPSSTYTPTPTWSQTLRPNSYRERSFESEYVGSQEFKTNTLGRGRPLSTYAKSNVDTIPERVRGVSVDRYNPNSYQPPVVAEHPPVQTHTLNVVPPAKSYHNPNVPAYHAQSRASVEPREQPIYPQSRQYAEARASPLQSRSFKYLQWITGTED